VPTWGKGRKPLLQVLPPKRLGAWGGARWFKDNLAPKDKADDAKPSLHQFSFEPTSRFPFGLALGRIRHLAEGKVPWGLPVFWVLGNFG
jgi:hypothetical protein